MTILVTGSSGHLGEALMRRLIEAERPVRGLDIKPSPFTSHPGSITDRAAVKAAMAGAEAVIHTATLHKPHIATHSRQDFIDVNIAGTLNLLEEAMASGVGTFIFTSTTSVFGDALRPPADAPAAWITETVRPVPKNIYGVTKRAAEDLVELMHKHHGMSAAVLRTSRFFPEEDDDRALRDGYADANAKANELLYRRVDIADVVDAHLLAIERAEAIGFDRFIISATTPFRRAHLADLRRDAPAVLERLFPGYAVDYRRRGWAMFPTIDRVYVNRHARHKLGWRPRYDFAALLDDLARERDPRSPLALTVGAKGYHDQIFDDGPYPIA